MELENFLRFLNRLALRHDPYENDHSENIAILARGLAEAANYPMAKFDSLILSAQLHDVGKLLIPEKVLNKHGRLTVEEIAQIHRHVEIGYDAVSALGLDPIVSQVILEHHECWDGTGYPHGLKSQNISLEARMIAVCDAFEALTSNRAYRLALTPANAIQIMQSGSNYDPELLDIFIKKVVRL